MTEPVFRYHPNPLTTGSAITSIHVCDVCGIEREIRYRGPIYGRQPDSLCLHCISSGEAARALGTRPTPADDPEEAYLPAQFSDAIDVPDDVSPAIVEEITQRTPGFFGWQQESWLFHCSDGAAFLGPAGYTDLEPYPDAVEMLRENIRRLGRTAPETERLLRRMDRTGEPTAYLFRCLHCGTYLASWDIG